MTSLEFVITCDRRSSDSSTALIYWENSLSSTSLLLTSCQISSSWTINYSLKTIKIALRTRILYHWSKSSIKQLWLHVYINLFNVYVTQVKSRIELFNTITLYLLIMCISLSSHISLLDEWQSLNKRTQFSTLQSRASWMQRNCLRDRKSKIETSLYKISSMKSKARTMHCKETAQTCIKNSSVMRWIEAINSLLST